MRRVDILPGDRSQKAQEIRRKMRREIWRKINELEDQIKPLRDSVELTNFPCILCGYVSCDRDCW